jgi:hypothetical protein
MDLNLEGKTVAVVGSSGNLLKHKYGPEIDKHDVIIRFNQARVKGYEEFVGSRTDIRIVNCHVLTGTTDTSLYSNYDKNFIPNLPPQLLVVSKPTYYNKQKRSPHNEVVLLSDDFHKYCERILNTGKDPSVGFLGTIMALNSKTVPSIYGFDQSATVDNKHYWEHVKKIGKFHKFSREKEIFKQLQEQGKIKIN